MKTRNIFGMMILAAAFASCSQEDIATGNNANNQSDVDVDGVVLNISDQMFANVEGGSRASDDASTNTTSFENGDQIGLYTVLNGTIVKSNLKYTYNGTNWVDDSGKATIVAAPGTVFVAYYPYSSTAPTVDESDVASLATTSTAEQLKAGAEGFYADKIENWTVAEDQSTKAKYTACDLMVAAAVPAADATQIDLSMYHQMALHELWFDQKVSKDNFYNSDMSTFKRYKYNIDDYGFYNIAAGKYRRIAKPNETIGYQGIILDVLDGEEKGGWYTNTDEGSIAAGKMRVFKYSTGSASLAETASPFDGIAVGDIIYSDGTYSSSYNSLKTPVAIVFSTSPSDNDKKLGYVHGYAIALYDVHTDGNYTVRYSNTNSDDAKISKGVWAAGTYQTTQATDVLYASTTMATQWSNLKGDMDGLTHCNAAIAKLGSTALSESNLRAIYLAKNYGVTRPAYTSGWYLPSIGQQYLWIKTMGGRSEDSPAAEASGVTLNWRSTYQDFYYRDLAASTGTSMNTYFGKITDTSKWDAWDTSKSGKYYWSSTERTGSSAFSLLFDTTGNLFLFGSHTKSNTNRRVRAVFAF